MVAMISKHSNTRNSIFIIFPLFCKQRIFGEMSRCDKCPGGVAVSTVQEEILSKTCGVFGGDGCDFLTFYFGVIERVFYLFIQTIDGASFITFDGFGVNNECYKYKNDFNNKQNVIYVLIKNTFNLTCWIVFIVLTSSLNPNKLSGYFVSFYCFVLFCFFLFLFGLTVAVCLECLHLT